LLVGNEFGSSVDYTMADRRWFGRRDIDEPSRCAIECISLRGETESVGSEDMPISVSQFKLASALSHSFCHSVEERPLFALLLGVEAELQ
jgi:hypothetical protein